jgi:hypothetical protein
VANERAAVYSCVFQIDISVAFTADNPYESMFFHESNLRLSSYFSLKSPSMLLLDTSQTPLKSPFAELVPLLQFAGIE